MPLIAPRDARLEGLTEAELAKARQLAEAIWRQHYTPIIGRAQVDYMLAARFSADELRRYVDAPDCWFKLLFVGEKAAGYCSYALDGADGAEAMKLEQLYLLQELRGHGLGGFMLRRVEAEARAQGRRRLVLTVNRHNVESIAVYTKSGFVIREEAVFDIGGGFVMDDYVMVKTLSADR